MKKELILSGIGGQGIVLMGECLGKAALMAGHQVTLAPAYGQEKRGSYVHCQLTIGEELYAPSISQADVVLAMDDDSLVRYEGSVKPQGTLLVNADTVTQAASRRDIRVLEIPLSALAREAGSGRSANMVGLGALVRAADFLPLEQVEQVVKAKIKPEVWESNWKALQLGYAYGG